MSAEIHQLSRHKLYKPNFPAVNLPKTLQDFLEMFGLPIGNPTAFRFRRTARGTEIWLHFDAGCRLNLSAAENIYLKNVEAARDWACEFAGRHGFEPREFISSRARRGDLTKPVVREIIRMIAWQQRFRCHYQPTNQESRNACDQLVARGMAEEHVLYKSSFVLHNGIWRAAPSYLATPLGREWYAKAKLVEAEGSEPECIVIRRPHKGQTDQTVE